LDLVSGYAEQFAARSRAPHGVSDHFHVKGFQIANTAMNEFGGPRRRSFGKILHFQKNRLHSSGCGLNSNPRASDPTTDDQYIIGGLCRFLNGLLPIFM